MQYLKDLGFIIKRTNVGESDRFISIFTKNNGKIDVVAKGIRKITSRRASKLEPLNLIRFQAVRSSKNFVLADIELVSSYDTLRQELSNIQILFLLCELIDRLCPIGQKHDEIFDLIYTTLNRVKREENDAMSVFQTKILSILGFWDGKREFKDDNDIRQFVESVIERKLKSERFFRV